MEKKTEKKKTKRKTSYDKPISLYSFKPKEILKKLLEIPPEKKEKMKAPRFTIILKGSDNDDGKLRLGEFLQVLEVITEP